MVRAQRGLSCADVSARTDKNPGTKPYHYRVLRVEDRPDKIPKNDSTYRGVNPTSENALNKGQERGFGFQPKVAIQNEYV